MDTTRTHMSDRRYLSRITDAEMQVILEDYEIDITVVAKFMKSDYKYFAVFVRDFKDFESIGNNAKN